MNLDLVFDWGDNRGQAPAGTYVVRKVQIKAPGGVVESLQGDHIDVMNAVWNPDTDIKAADKHSLYADVMRTTSLPGFIPKSIHVKYAKDPEPFFFVLGDKIGE